MSGESQTTSTTAPTTTDLRTLIRVVMNKGSKTQTTSKAKTSTVPVVPLKAKGPQRTKQQPRQSEHGELGDFSRSNSNPTSRSTPTTAFLGYEEVPKTQLHTKHADKPSVIDAETEMVRKAIRIAINTTGGAPSKRAAKHAAGPKMTKSDRVFQAGKGCGVGSSRSVTLGIVKAISAKETGCIVRKEAIDKATSQRNANTTQGNYNPMIVE